MAAAAMLVSDSATCVCVSRGCVTRLSRKNRATRPSADWRDRKCLAPLCTPLAMLASILMQVAPVAVALTAPAGTAGRAAVASRSQVARMQVEASEKASISEMSEQMLKMRAEMEQDERTAVMMQALRGQNLNDDDNAAVGTTMQVVEMTRGDGDDSLPVDYDPEALSAYFAKRPGAVFTRMAQIASTGFGW
eukprot:6624090-Prymnesium_polylepis.1